MNKQRRKDIAALIAKIGDLKTQIEALDIEGLLEEIEDIKSQEEEYKDNMPQAMQDGDKGSAADEAISHLETASSTFGEFKDAIDKLDEVVTELEEAQGS